MVVATSAWQEGGPVKQPVQALEMPEQLLIVRYVQNQNQRFLNHCELEIVEYSH